MDLMARRRAMMEAMAPNYGELLFQGTTFHVKTGVFYETPEGISFRCTGTSWDFRFCPNGTADQFVTYSDAQGKLLTIEYDVEIQSGFTSTSSRLAVSTEFTNTLTGDAGKSANRLRYTDRNIKTTGPGIFQIPITQESFTSGSASQIQATNKLSYTVFLYAESNAKVLIKKLNFYLK